MQLVLYKSRINRPQLVVPTMRFVVVLALAIFAVADARKGFGPGEQEWGYVDVRPEAHMFWWLYYTTADVAHYTEKPLIIWLQGGPGASSAGYGNFAELGPLDLDLKPRNFTWVKDANVLFIDNPVGSGFSYADGPKGYTTDNKQIGRDLVEMMRAFYEQLPEFKDVPLYITAESYGGKMVADFALLLHKEMVEGTIESNLKGVGLGDSWISPIDSVLTWAPFLLHMGAVDQKGHDDIMEAAKETERLLNAGKGQESTDMWGYTEYVIMDVAHNVDFYNVMKKIPSGWRNSVRNGRKGFAGPIAKPSSRDFDDEKLEKIMNGAVKETLGLKNTWGLQSGKTFQMLEEDFMKPVVDVVETLLNTTDIKVFVFTGQLDLIVDTPGTVVWVDNMNWIGSKEWKTAQRLPLTYAGYYEGYRKEVDNFGLYWVNRAGHMVPADNPWAMDFILRKLTNNYEGRKNSNH